MHPLKRKLPFAVSALLLVLLCIKIPAGDAKRVGPSRRLTPIASERSKLNKVVHMDDHRAVPDLAVALRKSPRGQPPERMRPVLPSAKQNLASASANAFWSWTRSVVSMCSDLAPSSASLRRQVKGYFSSDAEMLLLRLTEPICAAPASRDLALLVELVGRLEQTHSALSDRNPYRVIMRKLWKKATESSPWTVVRTACVAHHVMRYVDRKDASFIRSAVRQLRTEECDKPGENYFDRRTAMRSLCGRDSEWSALSPPEQRTYRAYVDFVLAFLSSPALEDEAVTAQMNAAEQDTKLLNSLDCVTQEMKNLSARSRKKGSLMGMCWDNVLHTADALLAGNHQTVSGGGGTDSSPIPELRRRVEELLRGESKRKT